MAARDNQLAVTARHARMSAYRQLAVFAYGSAHRNCLLQNYQIAITTRKIIIPSTRVLKQSENHIATRNWQLSFLKPIVSVGACHQLGKLIARQIAFSENVWIPIRAKTCWICCGIVERFANCPLAFQLTGRLLVFHVICKVLAASAIAEKSNVVNSGPFHGLFNPLFETRMFFTTLDFVLPINSEAENDLADTSCQ